MTYFAFFKKPISLFAKIQFLSGSDALYQNEQNVHTLGSAIVQKHVERYFHCPEIISDFPIKVVDWLRSRGKVS